MTYTLKEIGEIVLWTFLRDTTECGTDISVDDVNDEYNTDFSGEELVSAMIDADPDNYILEIETYEDSGQEMISLTVSILFGLLDEDDPYYEEAKRFQESGEMDRKIKNHLYQYFRDGWRGNGMKEE